MGGVYGTELKDGDAYAGECSMEVIVKDESLKKGGQESCKPSAAHSWCATDTRPSRA